MKKIITTLLSLFALSHLTPIEASAQTLRWPPPTLINPETRTVTNINSATTFTLDTSKDYVINMPSTPIRKGKVSIVGGRNVIIRAGEFNLNLDGTTPSISNRTMLLIRDSTGIVHIEGILGRGVDLSEGIQIDSPDAIIQIQNVRMEHLHANDQVNFSDNHPDCIQAYGGYKELRIDKFTCSTDYQGILISQDLTSTPLGKTYIDRTNIVSDPTARYTFWYGGDGDFISGTNIVQLNDVWLNVYEGQRTLKTSIWPENGTTISADQSTGLQFATFSSSKISGRINEGTPPNGDYVPSGVAGTSYTSPGYGNITPTPTPSTCTVIGDLDCDSLVNLADLSILLSNFGKQNTTRSLGDLNNDTVINLTDLTILLSNFG